VAQKIHRDVGALAVTLVGWSLGCVIVRKTARLYPAFVREVFTMGTPIIGGAKYTVLPSGSQGWPASIWALTVVSGRLLRKR
jgi:pimeloyl-ACP methyl ester carboxylesterase